MQNCASQICKQEEISLKAWYNKCTQHHANLKRKKKTKIIKNLTRKHTIDKTPPKRSFSLNYTRLCSLVFRQNPSGLHTYFHLFLP